MEPELKKEKHKVDDAVTVDKKHSIIHFQGTEEEDKQQSQSATTHTALLTNSRTNRSGFGIYRNIS
jgi:hypothetical protein